LDRQIENLKRVCVPYAGEYAGNRAYKEAIAERFGPGYGYVEAQALHAVIRYFRPGQIIEVGSGVSSSCILKAASMNDRESGLVSNVTCVEPYPSEWIRTQPLIRLIQKEVQDVPVEEFSRLRSGDLLFIDSTHTVRPDGDVNYLVLEVLPRLRSGVIIHFHDIYLPYDYQRDLLTSIFQWCETSLVRAFLVNNNSTDVLFCMSHLHYDRRECLKEVFPEYEPQLDEDGLYGAQSRTFEYPQGHFPTSLYLVVK
jgi:predicted O-methyltransferase YrrM